MTSIGKINRSDIEALASGQSPLLAKDTVHPPFVETLGAKEKLEGILKDQNPTQFEIPTVADLIEYLGQFDQRQPAGLILSGIMTKDGLRFYK